MLYIYNTLSKTKEEFKSLNPGKVGMYVCGPTVYDYIHIGNIKAYVMADIVRRYLEYSGYEVRMIKNITDVGHLTADDIAQGDTGEDKILVALEREKSAGSGSVSGGKTPAEIAAFYEEYFFATEKQLNILPAHYFPRATAHVSQMVKIISTLIKKGCAYEKNGNVFFDVTKFPDYGKLSGNTLEQLKVGARLKEHPDKKNPWDFALWLKAPEKHLLKWESPWSLGYPGWHIECSAMSTEYLGDTIDIHTGGEDNIFPHHEAEIAQTECATDHKFVRFWIHGRHLLVDGQKMSKSKGNFYRLEDILERGYSPMDLRLLLLSGHHRSQINFTWEAMEQARANLARISAFVHNLQQLVAQRVVAQQTVAADASQSLALGEYQARFEEAMDDDINTPLALNVLYELIAGANKLMMENRLDTDTAGKIFSLWEKMNKIFGLILAEKVVIPQNIIYIAEERKIARQNKDFAKSDELREKISELGYVIEDLKDNDYTIKQK